MSTIKVTITFNDASQKGTVESFFDGLSNNVTITGSQASATMNEGNVTSLQRKIDAYHNACPTCSILKLEIEGA